MPDETVAKYKTVYTRVFVHTYPNIVKINLNVNIKSTSLFDKLGFKKACTRKLTVNVKKSTHYSMHLLSEQVSNVTKPLNRTVRASYDKSHVDQGSTELKKRFNVLCDMDPIKSDN